MSALREAARGKTGNISSIAPVRVVIALYRITKLCVKLGVKLYELWDEKEGIWRRAATCDDGTTYLTREAAEQVLLQMQQSFELPDDKAQPTINRTSMRTVTATKSITSPIESIETAYPQYLEADQMKSIPAPDVLAPAEPDDNESIPESPEKTIRFISYAEIDTQSTTEGKQAIVYSSC
ncbi:hypothetical protein FDENT_4358 [Fusarium denticulatum]|uniref:Uncharacterized protein n=1 Tax=Fusarium denticulatum TaxID=48507 RepID=A0A8H5UKH6_9HYPO|nr:hypothetical protein FDENT_4358 [Fusarium denticulatum]